MRLQLSTCFWRVTCSRVRLLMILEGRWRGQGSRWVRIGKGRLNSFPSYHKFLLSVCFDASLAVLIWFWVEFRLVQLVKERERGRSTWTNFHLRYLFTEFLLKVSSEMFVASLIVLNDMVVGQSFGWYSKIGRLVYTIECIDTGQWVWSDSENIWKVNMMRQRIILFCLWMWHNK